MTGAAPRHSRTPSRVCFGPQDDHQAGDLQAIKHRSRELARVGKARMRDHGRRPGLGLPLAGPEQAIDQPVELGRLGGIEPAGHGGGRMAGPGTGRGDDRTTTSASVDCAARLSSVAVSGWSTWASLRTVATRSSTSAGRKEPGALVLVERDQGPPGRIEAAEIRSGERAVQRRVGKDHEAPRGSTEGRRPIGRSAASLCSQSRRSVAWQRQARPQRRFGRVEHRLNRLSDRHGQGQARDAAVGHSEEVIIRGHPLDQRHDVVPRVPRQLVQFRGPDRARPAPGRRRCRGRSCRTGRRTRTTRRSATGSRRLPRRWWEDPPCGRRGGGSASESHPCSTATDGSSSPDDLAAVDPQTVAADLHGIDPVAAPRRQQCEAMKQVDAEVEIGQLCRRDRRQPMVFERRRAAPHGCRASSNGRGLPSEPQQARRWDCRFRVT